MRAKVSAMTVSRALKSPNLVSPAVRKRIEAIVRKSGYVPHHGARTLASAKSKLIGVLVPSFSNELFVDLLAGIRASMEPHGYQMMIGETRYSPEKEERLFRAYLEHVPDGFLMTGFENKTLNAAYSSKVNGVPIVHMMDLSSRGLSVGFSQEQAGHAMGRHLIERGYRHLTHLSTHLDQRQLKRRAGFRRAVREAGGRHHYHEVAIAEPSSVDLGARLLVRMLEHAPKTDAIFACNDDLAVGALFECQRRGIKVPTDLAIAGFNDLAICGCTVPTITSVRTPRYEVGFQAAQLLLDVMNQRKPERRRIDLGFQLAARQST